jgi:glycine C-acetyltransferase
VFAKSLPVAMTIGALKRLEILKNEPQHRDDLWKIVNALQTGLKKNGFNIGKTESPVTPVYFSGGVSEATQITYDLRENFNVFCSIVVYPVVPKDVIMLRLIPTAVHTAEDVDYTIQAFKQIKLNLDAGAYSDGKIKKMVYR